MSREGASISKNSSILPKNNAPKYIGAIVAGHIIGLVSVIGLIRVLGPQAYRDFTCYFNSAKLLWEGKNVYTLEICQYREDYYIPMRYPPLLFAILLIIPLSRLETGIIIWIAISEVIFLIGIYLLISIHSNGTLWNKLRSNLAAFTLLVGLSLPLYYNLIIGQLSVFAFFSIAVFWYYSSKGQNSGKPRDEIVAGVGLSFAMANKMSPAVFLLIFLYRKQLWGFIVALGLNILGIFIFVSLWDLPLYTFLQDFVVLQNELGPVLLNNIPGEFIRWNNIFIIFAKVVLNVNNYWIISGILSGLVLMLAIMLKKKSINPEILYYVLNVSMLFIAGEIWFHHLLMIYPTIILILSRDNEHLRSSWRSICENTRKSRFKVLKIWFNERVFLILPILIFGTFLLIPLSILLFTKQSLYSASTFTSPIIVILNLIYSSLLFLYYLSVLSLGFGVLKGDAHPKNPCLGIVQKDR